MRTQDSITSIFSFIIIFTFLSTITSGQVLYENNNDFETSINSSSITIPNFVVPAGDDRLLVVSTSFRQSTLDGISFITFNGSNLTEGITGFQNFTGVNPFSSIWYITLGSGNSISGDINIQYSGFNTDYAVASAASYINVDQTIPIGNTDSNLGTGSFSSISISSNPDNMIVDQLLSGGPNTITAGSSQTELNNILNVSAHGNSYQQVTGTNTIMSWNKPNTTYTHVAMEINKCQPCNSGTPPTALFDINVIDPCVIGEIQFNDLSTDNPTNWNWTFPGGNPATSTLQNPLVFYSNSGFYNATLSVSNSNGTDTYTLPIDFFIDDVPITDFSFSVNDFTVNFLNNSFNSDSYVWDFGDGNNSTQENPTHIYNQDGTYTVTLTTTNNCGSTSISYDIIIATPPIADFTSSQNIGCAPLTVSFENLSSLNSVDFFWEFPGGTPSTSTDSDPVITYNSPGLFNVKLTVSNLQGDDVEEKVSYIEVNQTPIVDFSFTNNANIVTFINQTSNADNYLWDFGDGNTSILENPSHTYTLDGVYTVTLTCSNQCGTSTFSDQVIIATPPVSNFTSDIQSGCTSFSVNYMNLSSNNSTNFLWEFEGGIPQTSTALNPTVLYENPGTFEVKLTSINQQGSDILIETNYIESLASPISDFDYTIEGTEISFNNLSIGGTNFFWDFGDGNTSTQINPTHNYSSIGSYDVKLISISNQCGDDTINKLIQINLKPLANFSTEEGNVGCVSHTAHFINLSSNNPTNFEWHFEGGNPEISTIENPVVLYENTGTFDVVLIVSNSIGTDTLVFNNYITISTLPTADFDFIFQQDTVFFSNYSDYATDYVWTFGNGDTSRIFEPIYIYGEEGVWNVELKASNHCGEFSQNQSVTTTLNPIANFTSNKDTICQGDSIYFYDNSINSVQQYYWFFEGGTPQISNAKNPIVYYDSIGEFDVKLIVQNQIGIDSIEVQEKIIVNGKPNPIIIESIDKNQISLSFENVSDFNDVLWTLPDSTTSKLDSVKYLVSQNGIFSTSLKLSNTCGDTVVNINSIVDAYPTAVIEISSDTLCTNKLVEFRAEDVTEGSYMWYFEGGNPSTSLEQNPSTSYLSPGTYDVKLTVVNSLGEDSILHIDFITIDSLPEALFDLEYNGIELTTFNNSSHANTNYWDFGDGNFSIEFSPTHKYINSGIYQISLTVSNSCGIDSFKVEKEINPLIPEISFSSSDSIGCLPQIINFYNHSTNNPTEFSWKFEGGDPSTSSIENPIVTYNSPGQFDIEVTMSNAVGESSILLENFITIYDHPVANFDYQINDGEVTFINNSLNSPTNHFWNFGNQEFTNEVSPIYNYQSSGLYEVILIVENICGSDTIKRSIDVMVSSSNNTNFDNNLFIYPTPFNNVLSINIQSHTPQQRTFELYSLHGQKVKESSVYSGLNSINTSDLHPNMYLYVIKEHGKIIGRGKVVKQ